MHQSNHTRHITTKAPFGTFTKHTENTDKTQQLETTILNCQKKQEGDEGQNSDKTEEEKDRWRDALKRFLFSFLPRRYSP